MTAPADDPAGAPAGADVAAAAPPASRPAAALVAAGIFASRVVGLVRQRVFASYFETSDQADAFTVASRMPNFLQNLFGEGVLSASFIPVYASLIARGDRDEARRVAGGILALLALAMSVFVTAGVLLAPALVRVLTPGFTGDKRDLTILLVRIFFPAAALLVLSAWCLGILNSHRRFFLSYAAPVVWNGAIIATLLAFGGEPNLSRLAMLTAWGAVVGSALQLLVQLPVALSLLGRLTVAVRRRASGVREVVRNFGPAVAGRGVGQISAYVDNFLASLLVTGSAAVLGYAQALYLLPVSLFGMSVSAAELPAMASLTGEREQVAERLRQRLRSASARVAFFVVPSAVAFIGLGDVVAATVYQSGDFGPDDARWVWGVLAGTGVGLLAATLGRLYASMFYALRDPRTPVRFAAMRVGTAVVLGVLFSMVIPPALGLGGRWATAGLGLASGLAAWVEFALLRRAAVRRIGAAAMPRAQLVRLIGAAVLAVAIAWGVKLGTAGAALPPLVAGIAALGSFGLAYLAAAAAFGIPEIVALRSRLSRRLNGGRGGASREPPAPR